MCPEDITTSSDEVTWDEPIVYSSNPETRTHCIPSGYIFTVGMTVEVTCTLYSGSTVLDYCTFLVTVGK